MQAAPSLETSDVTFHIALLPGDGIGPEVVAESRKVLSRLASLDDFDLCWVGTGEREGAGAGV